MAKIAIIGDFNPELRSHLATNKAIEHSGGSYEWVSTENIDRNFGKYSGFLIAPGGPCKNREGVLQMIEFARLNEIPTLGTCGGFQHMVIEFARNVLHIKNAEHAKYDPKSSNLVITPLACNLKGRPLEITIMDRHSKVFAAFGREKIEETYYCNFGLDPAYQEEIDLKGFKVVGTDARKEARILELTNHRFFVTTLFMPQDQSREGNPHPLITAFVRETQCITR